MTRHVSRLIVFDLDGTLIDSRLDLTETANELLAGHGAPPLSEAAVSAMVGDGARMLVTRALAAAGIEVNLDEALAEFLRIYSLRLLNHTRLYPGVVEAIDAVSGQARLAVLTNKPEMPTWAILRGLGLDASFEWVIGGDATFPRKPNPAALNHLMATAGARASETLMVGDSTIDVETAHRSGVLACAALYGFGQSRGQLPLNQGDLVVSSSLDLGHTLAGWLNAT